MQNILILGTGKMARNIGLFFLRNGRKVDWGSRDAGRAESFSAKIKKDIRRLALILDKPIDEFNAHVGTISHIPQKKYDLILESINEDLYQKQEIIRSILPLIKSDTILASNSSSILPNQIHDIAIGLHFFYPIELTGLVEVITNQNIQMEKINELTNELKSWEINPIMQDEQNAFVVNRLLLPMQAEAFKLLQGGYPAGLVNESTKSDQIKIGQFDLMDSIGFDVLLPSIKNYVSRMSDVEQKKYEALIGRLTLLIQQGKLGKKNKNGLLMGEPFPWQQNEQCSEDLNQLKQRFYKIFENTYKQFIESKEIEKGELKNVLETLFS